MELAGKDKKIVSLTPVEEELLRVISAELRGEKTVAAGDMLEELLDTAEAHSVVPFIFNAVSAATGGSGSIFERVSTHTKRLAYQSYRLLFETKRLIMALSQKGINVVVLKGAVVSSFYDTPEYRKSGDIDILLCDVSKRNIARDILEDAGYRCLEDQPNLHQIVFIGPYGIEVELHVMLVEPFDNERINRYTDSLVAMAGTSVGIYDVMGISLPGLGAGLLPYELLLHMLQHFLREGFGIRLLCDWVVYWNRMAEAGQRADDYRRFVQDTKISGFADMISAVCRYRLGLSEEGEALAGRFSGKPVPVEDAIAFFREIFDSGEFGLNEKYRMVMLRDQSLFSYLREFHHQMHINFPKAGKVWILWPVLWVITLYRFIYNNITLRKTSTIAIIKKSGERSRIMEDIGLWK